MFEASLTTVTQFATFRRESTVKMSSSEEEFGYHDEDMVSLVWFVCSNNLPPGWQADTPGMR